MPGPMPPKVTKPKAATTPTTVPTASEAANTAAADEVFKRLLGKKWSKDMEYRIEPERRYATLVGSGEWEDLAPYKRDSRVIGRKKKR